MLNLIGRFSWESCIWLGGYIKGPKLCILYHFDLPEVISHTAKNLFLVANSEMGCWNCVIRTFLGYSPLIPYSALSTMGVSQSRGSGRFRDYKEYLGGVPERLHATAHPSQRIVWKPHRAPLQRNTYLHVRGGHLQLAKFPPKPRWPEPTRPTRNQNPCKSLLIDSTRLSSYYARIHY